MDELARVGIVDDKRQRGRVIGRSPHSSAGETFSPSQVDLRAISTPAAKAWLVDLKAKIDSFVVLWSRSNLPRSALARYVEAA